MPSPSSSLTKAEPSVLSRVALILYLLQIGLNLAMPVILAWLRYRFLHLTEIESLPFLAWMEALHLVMGRLWWARLLVTVAANGALMAWLYVTYRAFARRGAHMRYRSHWAVTGFFVPFLNFVRPYQVVSDAWRGAVSLRQPAGAGRVATPLVVKFWWALIWAAIIVSGLGGESVMPGRMELDATLLVAILSSVLAAVLSIGVIASLEGERLRSSGAAPVGLLGPWPLKVTAGAAAFLAVLLVLTGAYGLARLEMGRITEARTVGPLELPPAEPGVEPPFEILPDGVAGGVEGGVPGEVAGGVVGGVVGSLPDEPPPPLVQPVRVGGNIKAPTKTKDVQPVYPAIAQSARVQGVVSLEAIIGPDGRVIGVKVLRSIPLLDQAAMDAVRRWEFTPTFLNGVPVPVIMTLTVNFTLQ